MTASYAFSLTDPDGCGMKKPSSGVPMSPDQQGSDDATRRRTDPKRDAPKTAPKPHSAFIGKSAPPPRREPKGGGKKGR
jgi:hypothetical protein